MSWDACIHGFGPFSKAVIPDLGYQADFYEDFQEGQMIAVTYCVGGGKSLAQELLCHFGNPIPYGGELTCVSTPYDRVQAPLYFFQVLQWVLRMKRRGFRLFFDAHC